MLKKTWKPQGPKKYYEVYITYKSGKKAYFETEDISEVEKVKEFVSKASDKFKIRFCGIELVDIDSSGSVTRSTYFQVLNQRRK